MRLADSPRFQKEYKEFRDAIDKISDQKNQTGIRKTLKEFNF